MNDVFWPFIDDFVISHLDDIVVCRITWDEHVKHLRQVFDTLKKEKFYVKLSKCEFGKTSLVFLGYVIGASEQKIDPYKVEVIVNWPNPTIITEVRSLLGAVQYQRKFIANFNLLRLLYIID